ncbi:MAG: epoxyqueuosine reductase [Clostridia bacterium]|nr:epoxyqueuosine reductase [Clostridia bacterium]
MKNEDILSSVKNILTPQGILARAIPLSECRITKPYLLDKCGIATTDGTAIMLAVPYVVPNIAKGKHNVSLYAAAKDYHLFFNRLSDTLLPRLRQEFPEADFAIFADHSPIDEIDAAVRAGLGVKGQNGLLLTREYGSFVFIGEIITSASPKLDGYIPRTAEMPKCSNCGRCLAACPAGCTSESRAGCLSAMTQKKGELTPDEQAALAAHPLVWGCDECQLACPINQKILSDNVSTDVDFFREKLTPLLDAKTVNSMSDDKFSSRAYAWRGKNTILRNLKLKNTNGKDSLC